MENENKEIYNKTIVEFLGKKYTYEGIKIIVGINDISYSKKEVIFFYYEKKDEENDVVVTRCICCKKKGFVTDEKNFFECVDCHIKHNKQ